MAWSWHEDCSITAEHLIAPRTPASKYTATLHCCGLLDEQMQLERMHIGKCPHCPVFNVLVSHAMFFVFPYRLVCTGYCTPILIWTTNYPLRGISNCWLCWHLLLKEHFFFIKVHTDTWEHAYPAGTNSSVFLIHIFTFAAAKRYYV